MSDRFKTKGSFKRHDHFYYKARHLGFVARSIFKLEELDQQFRLIHPKSHVLDLGCAPGSWLQYVSNRVSPNQGKVVGVDLLPVKSSFGPHVQTVQKDIFVWIDDYIQEQSKEHAPCMFDVVLSDMAPNTTGIKSVDQDRSVELCRMALHVAKQLLKPKGHFCAKILEGGELPAFVFECKQLFETVHIKKPKGTRSISMETYIVGLFKKP